MKRHPFDHGRLNTLYVHSKFFMIFLLALSLSLLVSTRDTVRVDWSLEKAHSWSGSVSRRRNFQETHSATKVRSNRLDFEARFILSLSLSLSVCLSVSLTHTLSSCVYIHRSLIAYSLYRPTTRISQTILLTKREPLPCITRSPKLLAPSSTYLPPSETRRATANETRISTSVTNDPSSQAPKNTMCENLRQVHTRMVLYRGGGGKICNDEMQNDLYFEILKLRMLK